MTFAPNYLVGNHGLEGLSPPKNSMVAYPKICQDWIYIIMQFLTKQEGTYGIAIEDKTYSLAIHYRKSRNKKKVKNLLETFLPQLPHSPRILNGKCVVNIIPTGAPHKGMALLEIINESKKANAFYIGDDSSDEDVFNLDNQNIFKVRIGFKRDSNAKYYIKNQAEIIPLLRFLLSSFKKNNQKIQNN
ncbi:MAG: hypothetical protein HQK53_07510 [Oligoflexia bacterium]|nr:hypothetical protein [Oligoflexia bacterium]